MGYSYSYDGKLACDHCGGTEAVRKRRCPYGYCPAPAICKACWDGGISAKSAQYHKDYHCKERHAEFVAEEKLKEETIASGAGLRVAALNCDDGQVKVWFRYPTGDKVYHMARETYQAISLFKVATLADYQAIGPVSGPFKDTP